LSIARPTAARLPYTSVSVAVVPRVPWAAIESLSLDQAGLHIMMSERRSLGRERRLHVCERTDVLGMATPVRSLHPDPPGPPNRQGTPMPVLPLVSIVQAFRADGAR
jgi:hypothetical protein